MNNPRHELDYIEVNPQGLDKESIRSLILATESRSQVLWIKGGLNYLSQEDWYSFLANDCNLQPDRRHFETHQNGNSDDVRIKESDWWEISYQPEKANSYAYSSTSQPLHNDNAWFKDAAEINFNIMVKQALEGGASTIYPCWRLVQDLQNEDPELLHMLKTIKVTIRKGNDPSVGRETTILTLDGSCSSHWNYYRTVRDDNLVDEMCERFFEFLQDKERSNKLTRINLRTGDCLVWNDQLVLHGRDKFKATKKYDRILRQSMWKLRPKNDHKERNIYESNNLR